MVHIDLSDEEMEVLRSVVESEIGELRMEISNTDNQDFREALKHREEVLKRCAVRLGGSHD